MTEQTRPDEDKDEEQLSVLGTQPVPSPMSFTAMKVALSRKLRMVWSLTPSSKQQPMPRGWFTRHELARLHVAGLTSPESLDDQTWRDLDFDTYIDQAAGDCSVFGRQWLCARLRGSDLTVGADLVQVLQLRALVDDANLARLWIEATFVMRLADVEIADTLFAPASVAMPHWVSMLWLVPVGFGLALALIGAGFHGLGALLILSALGTSAAVQIHLYGRLAAWQKQKRAIGQLLSCAMRMPDMASTLRRVRSTTPAAEDLSDSPLLPDLRPLWLAFGPTWLERLAGLAEYADLILLSQYRRMAADMRHLDQHRQAMREVYLVMSQREANAWLASHLRDSECFCWNQARNSFVGARVNGMRNPLLDKSTPIDLAIGDRGIFLTGKNGSGKSTLLRSLGMNAVLARALGFCMAGDASIPYALVQTSIRIEDSLALGRSLYVAELLRASDMLDKASRAKACLIIFDEIFRGTNHMESVSAAGAVIQRLAPHATVVVSSHHVDLAPMVERSTRPLHLVETPSALMLLPGVLAETNGIDLLLTHGFDAALHATALQLHQQLAQRALGTLGQKPPA